MKEIPLSRGKVALVDDADYEALSCHKWFCVPNHGNTFYAVRQSPRPQRLIYMHRVILEVLGDDRVDHRDGNGLNNTRENLRLCSPTENQRNRQTNRNSRSGFKGVIACGNKWYARIRVDGRVHYLGMFRDAIDAAYAYDEAAKKHFGEFAHPNFPCGPTGKLWTPVTDDKQGGVR